MDDLISRLSELRCQYNCFDENERDAYHTLSEAIKALSALPSADVQHWIPVTEHLPIIETDVLLTAYDGKRQFVGWIDVFGKWYTSEDEEVVSGYEPLAWMPLPEPYKDGEIITQ